MDDAIEMIERMNLDENLAPSHRGLPKWLIKTLESVHPNEVRKTKNRMNSRQDRGNVDNSNLGDVDDMDVSYDCELNLSTNLELTSFEEATSHDELKEAM